jgi:hypothetical protein
VLPDPTFVHEQRSLLSNPQLAAQQSFTKNVRTNNVLSTGVEMGRPSVGRDVWESAIVISSSSNSSSSSGAVQAIIVVHAAVKPDL